MKYIKSKQTEELLVEISIQTFIIVSNFQSKMQFSINIVSKNYLLRLCLNYSLRNYYRLQTLSLKSKTKYRDTLHKRSNKES